MGIAWARQMKDAFGASFLWLVAFVYFSQGFRSFVWTAVTFQMKDVLKLSPSASQFLVSVAYFPWSIKPIYGILSDCLPIRRRRRIPYLIIASVLTFFPWLILGSMPSFAQSSKFLTLMLTIQNFGSAMADVVIDAMIAEAIQSSKAGFAGDLQSLSWFSMAFGGICGSLMGGYTLSNIKISAIYIIFSIIPAVQLVSCIFVKEVGSRLPNSVNSVEHDRPDDLDQVDNKSFNSKKNSRKSNGMRRRKSLSKNVQNSKSATDDAPAMMESPGSELMQSLKSAFNGLCGVFKQPVILRPIAWFFFSNVMVPNLSTVLFYYQTDVLHLGVSFLGNARVIGWFSLILGTYTYNRFLKYRKLRSVLMLGQVGLATTGLLNIVLLSKAHHQVGIPDKYMVLWASAFHDAIHQFKMMPFLILSGQLCPPGIEGTLFSLFMSIHNLSNNISSLSGATLSSALGISNGDFSNLLPATVVQLLTALLPLGFLFLIPKEATGIAAS